MGQQKRRSCLLKRLPGKVRRLVGPQNPMVDPPYLPGMIRYTVR